MDTGEAIRALAMITMVAPMLASRIAALRPYHGRIWGATALLYLIGGSAALLWRFFLT